MPSAVILILDLIFIILIPDQVKELTQEGVTTRFMPYVVTILIAVCAAVDLIQIGFKEKRRAEKESKTYFDRRGILRVFLSILAMAVYLLTVKMLGFVVATILLVAVIMLLMGSRNWKQILLVSVLLTLVVYVVFKLGLNLRLPTGLFFF